MSRILSCLSGMATTDDRPKALWTADDEAHLPLRLSDGDRKPGCIFCDVSVERGFAVVYSDDELIASHDRYVRVRGIAGPTCSEYRYFSRPRNPKKTEVRTDKANAARSPRAAVHLLIIPRRHVGTSQR